MIDDDAHRPRHFKIVPEAICGEQVEEIAEGPLPGPFPQQGDGRKTEASHVYTIPI